MVLGFESIGPIIERNLVSSIYYSFKFTAKHALDIHRWWKLGVDFSFYTGSSVKV